MRIDHEFAFDLDADDDAWLNTRLEEFGAMRKGGVAMRALYLDTPEGSVAELGLAFGLRQSGKIAPAGASRRRQPSRAKRWTRFVEDISPMPSPPAALEARLRDAAIRETLALAAACEGTETVYNLPFGDGVVEIGADRSTVRADGRTRIVATVTLRHVSGDLADFLRATRTFADPAEMRLCVETAMVRARRRLRLDRRSHVGAFPPRLGRAMDAATAFQSIAWACFEQFLRNEAGVRELRDPEAVHQCRVALRRLRAALRFFKLKAGEGPGASWRPDLKHILALLGEARDLDVLLDGKIAPHLPPGSTAEADCLASELRSRRERAYDKLVATLQAARTKSFCLDLALWIAAGRFGAPDIWSQSIVAYLRERLAEEMRKLHKRGRHVETDSEHARHRTRIAAKNLRYGAEFFESLLAGKAAHERFAAVITALKKIQELLGDRNDEVNARRFFAQLAKDWRPSDADAQASAATVTQMLAQPASAMPEAEFLRKAKEAFRRLEEAKPFWAKIEDGSKRRR